MHALVSTEMRCECTASKEVLSLLLCYIFTSNININPTAATCMYRSKWLSTGL